MSTWPSPTSAASSIWRAPSQGIWSHSPRPSPRFDPASTGLSTPCSPLNMSSKCSVVPCPMALHALRSHGSPTALPKFSPKHANSHHPDSGHRLAGYVGNWETIHLDEKSATRGLPLGSSERITRHSEKAAAERPERDQDRETRMRLVYDAPQEIGPNRNVTRAA